MIWLVLPFCLSTATYLGALNVFNSGRPSTLAITAFHLYLSVWFIIGFGKLQQPEIIVSVFAALQSNGGFLAFRQCLRSNIPTSTLVWSGFNSA